MAKVYVGMSGGVDSSVTAALLKAQGHDVTGVFMKNWAQDLPGFKCPWKEDLTDAKRVAVQLQIPFKIYDFQTEYRQKVVDYMIAEYKLGRTPNPDIMCNQEVKFKLFLETALEDGADMIATGHYARIGDSGSSKLQGSSSGEVSGSKLQTRGFQGVIPDSIRDPVDTLERSESTSGLQLLTSVDTNKDQTYFLYRVTEEALSKTLFPLGEMKKPEVRKKAAELGLITAQKKDSVGICFVGEIGIKEFLGNFVDAFPGSIIEKDSGKIIGQHEGAIYYTIGQRHGLNVGGGMPYYVVGKNMKKNEVYVSTNLDDPELWHASFEITNVHWINNLPPKTAKIEVRVRHRGPLNVVTQLEEVKKNTYLVSLKDEIRALAAGQSAVFYSKGVCLGGGIII